MLETIIWFFVVSFTCGVGWVVGTTLMDLTFAAIFLQKDDDDGW